MGIITVDDLSVPEYSSSNGWLEEPPEQPEIAPTKVSDYDAFDENKLEHRLRVAKIQDADMVLELVESWLILQENKWSKFKGIEAQHVAGSFRTIRLHELRNK